MAMRTMRLFAVVLAVQPVIAQRSQNPRILDYSFRDEPVWHFRSGRVLEVRYEEKKKTVIQQDGAILYSIEYPDVIHQIITSERHDTLLFLVFSQRTSGGADYAYLLTVHEKPNQQLAFEKRLPREVSPMRKHQWIAELGAVSDDAGIALVKMGEPDRDRTPYKIGYVWETWDLVSPMLLKTGLRLDPEFAR